MQFYEVLMNFSYNKWGNLDFYMKKDDARNWRGISRAFSQSECVKSALCTSVKSRHFVQKFNGFSSEKLKTL